MSEGGGGGGARRRSADVGRLAGVYPLVVNIHRLREKIDGSLQKTV
jgi:hypothetical protein